MRPLYFLLLTAALIMLASFRPHQILPADTTPLTKLPDRTVNVFSHQDATFNPILQLRQEESHHVIQTSINLSEIHLVCHYGPFLDSKILHRILSTRWMGRLDVFLSSLGVGQSNRDPKRWNNHGFKSHKAGEIIRRLRPEPPVPKIWGYKWNQSTAESTMHASRIADEINSHYSEVFRDVPFIELVKAACGYPSNVITSLLQGVATTRNELCSLIQDFDALKSKFKLVEQDLCAQHPIAYWIVSTSLCEHEYPPDPSDALTLLTLPIQDLVADTSFALIPMLKRLAWLSVQYHDKVANGYTHWEGLLSHNFQLFDEISSMSPRQVAQSMTAKDLMRFGRLCYNDFSSQSGSLSALSTRWSRVAHDIKGCCIADHDLVDKISDVTVILLRFRNFYAATAFLHGLLNAGVHPKKLSPYWKLISTTDNYAFYRLQWAKAPGLPFLVPHTYGRNIGRRARDFFKFTSYYGWRDASNEDDLSCYSDGQSLAPETLRLRLIIWNVIGLLASFLVAPCLPWKSVRRSLSTHGALHSDVEKVLPDYQAPACEPPARSGRNITAPLQQRGGDWETEKNGQGDDLPFVDGNSSQNSIMPLNLSFSPSNDEIGLPKSRDVGELPEKTPNSVPYMWRRHFVGLPKRKEGLRVPREPRMRYGREQKTEKQGAKCSEKTPDFLSYEEDF